MRVKQLCTIHFPTDDEVFAILKEQVAIRVGVGFVVGLIDPDGSQRVIAYGDPGPGMLPLDGDSVFEIGSITKTFTGTLLADMVLRGEVDLDTPIRQYLPAGRRVPLCHGQEITLLHLAMHTSGLPCEASNFRVVNQLDPYAEYSIDMMFEFLAGYDLPRETGALYEYSNIGVSLLGYILTLHSGIPYEELVSERILKPLEMAMTGATLSPAMQTHLALGHDVQGEIVPKWHLQAYAPAGALCSTAHDLLRYAKANLLMDETQLGRAMHLAHQARPIADTGQSHGLTWGIGSNTHQHFGGTGGYVSSVILDYKHDAALVLLANSADGESIDLAWHLLDRNHTLAPPSLWKQREAIPLAPDEFAQYTGEYLFEENMALRLTPGFTTRICQHGDGLVIHDDLNCTYQIFASGSDEFFYRDHNATLTFQRNADGTVTGLVFHFMGQEATAEKRKV